jgi:hypothetical protein
MRKLDNFDGIKNIYYVADYKNDPLVEYFQSISNIQHIKKI